MPCGFSMFFIILCTLQLQEEFLHLRMGPRSQRDEAVGREGTTKRSLLTGCSVLLRGPVFVLRNLMKKTWFIDEGVSR